MLMGSQVPLLSLMRKAKLGKVDKPLDPEDIAICGADEAVEMMKRHAAMEAKRSMAFTNRKCFGSALPPWGRDDVPRVQHYTHGEVADWWSEGDGCWVACVIKGVVRYERKRLEEGGDMPRTLYAITMSVSCIDMDSPENANGTDPFKTVTTYAEGLRKRS